MWEILVDLLFFVLAIFFLVKATGIVTDALENIADSGNAAKFAITSFLGAIATSLPELLVSVMSSIKGESGLVLGVLLGSNIANITIAVGLSSFIGGGLSVLGRFVKKDVIRALIMMLFPIILLMDGELSFYDGILLILSFVFYYIVVFKENTYEESFDFNVDDKGFEIVGKIFHRKEKHYRKKQIAWFGLGIVALLVSAEMVVRSGKALASGLSLPMILVGLFFVAFGSCLPEIAFGIKACRKKESGMLFGNLLGSLVSNLTLILGIAVMINPIIIDKMEWSLGVAIGAQLFSYLLLWRFLKSKLYLSKIEGLILAILYLLFIGLEYKLGLGV